METIDVLTLVLWLVLSAAIYWSAWSDHQMKKLIRRKKQKENRRDRIGWWN